jgi:hypothetical protein
MSKRSKRSGGGRGFGKREKDMQIESETGLGFTVMASAFRLAAQKLAAFVPSINAREWEERLVREAIEQLSVEMLDGMIDQGETKMIENASPISSSLSSVVKIAR